MYNRGRVEVGVQSPTLHCISFYQDVLLWAVFSVLTGGTCCWCACCRLDWLLPAVEWLAAVLDEASLCLSFIRCSLASWMCFLAGSWLGSNSRALPNSWMATSKSPSLARTTPTVNRKCSGDKLHSKLETLCLNCSNSHVNWYTLSFINAWVYYALSVNAL